MYCAAFGAGSVEWLQTVTAMPASPDDVTSAFAFARS